VTIGLTNGKKLRDLEKTSNMLKVTAKLYHITVVIKYTPLCARIKLTITVLIDVTPITIRL